MKYTLSQAAEATGKNKTTIQRAIKNGKISAQKNDHGAYEIDPSELHRVFPIKAAQQAKSNNTQHDAIPDDTNHLEQLLNLGKELAVMKERNRGLENERDLLQSTVQDLRKRLDHASLLLEDKRDQKPSRGFLGLFSRK